MSIDRSIGQPPEQTQLNRFNQFSVEFTLVLQERRTLRFPSAIDLVFAFATKDDSPYPDGTNRERLETALSVTKKITAIKRVKKFGDASIHDPVTVDDISFFGPNLLINGKKIANRQFLDMIDEGHIELPPNRTLVLDDFFRDPRNSGEHENAFMQLKSLFQEITDTASPLYGATDIAIVSNSHQFMLIPYLINDFEQEFADKLRTMPTFWAYASPLPAIHGERTILNIFDLESEKLNSYHRGHEKEAKPSENILIA